MTQLFRKKPVTIEAIQFKGGWAGDGSVIANWIGRNAEWSSLPDGGILTIHTPEGAMMAKEGDWIIKGVNGEFYPCKPDIFEKTYEAV